MVGNFLPTQAWTWCETKGNENQDVMERGLQWEQPVDPRTPIKVVCNEFWEAILHGKDFKKAFEVTGPSPTLLNQPSWVQCMKRAIQWAHGNVHQTPGSRQIVIALTCPEFSPGTRNSEYLSLVSLVKDIRRACFS